MSLLSFFEVQTLIADSFPNTEIAVKTQRGPVMRKMHAESLADLVRVADKLKLPIKK